MSIVSISKRSPGAVRRSCASARLIAGQPGGGVHPIASARVASAIVSSRPIYISKAEITASPPLCNPVSGYWYAASCSREVAVHGKPGMAGRHSEGESRMVGAGAAKNAGFDPERLARIEPFLRHAYLEPAKLPMMQLLV